MAPMLTRFFLKPAPIVAVQVATDPQHAAQNRLDVQQLTNGRANPGSQRADSFIVELPTGGGMAHPGDWIVRYENGHLAILTDEELREGYETLLDESEVEPRPAPRRPTHEEIAKRAELIAEERAKLGEPGTPERDWSEAERQLTREQA